MTKRLQIAVKLAAAALDVPTNQVLSSKKTRSSDLWTARCLSWWLVRSTSQTRLIDIGEAFGITHASVINGIQKCEDLRESDASFRALSDTLRERLSQECPAYGVPS